MRKQACLDRPAGETAMFDNRGNHTTGRLENLRQPPASGPRLRASPATCRPGASSCLGVAEPPITSCRLTTDLKGPRPRSNTFWRHSLLANTGTGRSYGVLFLRRSMRSKRVWSRRGNMWASSVRIGMDWRSRRSASAVRAVFWLRRGERQRRMFTAILAMKNSSMMRGSRPSVRMVSTREPRIGLSRARLERPHWAWSVSPKYYALRMGIGKSST